MKTSEKRRIYSETDLDFDKRFLKADEVGCYTYARFNEHGCGLTSDDAYQNWLECVCF